MRFPGKTYHEKRERLVRNTGNKMVRKKKRDQEKRSLIRGRRRGYQRRGERDQEREVDEQQSQKLRRNEVE